MTTIISCTKKYNKDIDIEPFVQTDDSRCGPATLKMVLNYYGIKASEDELAKECNHTYKNGCKNSDMERVLNSYGFDVESKENGTIEEIKEWVDEGIPVIVDWFTGGVNPKNEDVPNGHSSIVVGVDETHIRILDPEHGEIRNLKHEEFMRVWFDWEGTNEIQPWTKMNIRYMLVAW